MVSYQVRVQCDAHNKLYRNVKMFNRFPMDRIYRSGGNLLLTGGSPEQRTEILTELILSTRYQYPDLPILILSSNPLTEGLMIQAAESGRLGKLFVISEHYPNYDFFFQMSPVHIAGIFARIAENKNYRDASAIHDYVLSFLSGLKAANDGKINLASICRFSKNSDTIISDYVLNNEMAEAYDTINGTKEGGRSFRSLLKVMSDAVKQMTTPDCETHFNLTEVATIPCTVLINTKTSDVATTALYFDSVLRILIGKGAPFAFFLDESTLLSEERFQKTVDNLKKYPQSLVCCSTENALAVCDKDFLKNFGREIILLGGNINPSDTQELLTELGEYTHFEPAEYAGTPPSLLFSLAHSKNDTIITYTRPKLLLEETNGYSIIIRGHNSAEIAIVRKK